MNHAESKLQAACVKWFRLQYPDTLIFAIPNGGARSAITGAILKAEGVLAGVPDLFVAKSGHVDDIYYDGLFIEMKSGKGKQTESQKEIQKRLQAAGYYVEVCHSFDEFKETVEWYMG